jgi:hypothetical protein
MSMGPQQPGDGNGAEEEARARHRRRAELLAGRERAARARRSRGLRLRPPSAQPLILPGARRTHLD